MLEPVPAGEGGSLGSEHTSLIPRKQLDDTTDMDTDMMRIKKENRCSLCAKCD